MLKLVRIVLAASFLLSFNALSDELSDTLDMMASAMKLQNYEGVFVLRKNNNLVTMKVVHGVDSGLVMESIESLNGETRKIIRNGNNIISIYPKLKLVTIGKNKKRTSLHPVLPENLNELKDYYTVVQTGNGRVAGIETTNVEVIPSDEFRYGYRYWIDKDTGLLLKCDLLDENRSVIEQMMFTDIKYLDKVPAISLQYDADYKKELLNENVPLVKELAWKAGKLPKGFMFAQGSSKNDKSNSLHYIYTDGLASLSVFIEKGRAAHGLNGSSNMGAINIFGLRKNDYHVTVMGEVPAATVMSVAQSMEKMK